MTDPQHASPVSVLGAVRRPDAALRLVLDPGGAPRGRADILDHDLRTCGTADLGTLFDTLPCFARGTLIATEHGERPVESLRADDRVATRDNGLQPVVWVGTERFGWRELGALPLLRPICIRRGALGADSPARDLIVSPNHRMLVSVAGDEVLVTAHSLVGAPGIEVIAPREVDYVQLLLPRHDVVLANGAWSESFLAADTAVAALSDTNRSALRSELRGMGGAAPVPARPQDSAKRRAFGHA